MKSSISLLLLLLLLGCAVSAVLASSSSSSSASSSSAVETSSSSSTNEEGGRSFVEIDSADNQHSNASSIDRVVVHVDGKSWSRPWPVIVAALLLLLGAVAAPLVVPWLISFYIRRQQEEQEAEEQHSSSVYGTFSGHGKEPHFVSDSELDLIPADLPPQMDVKFDRSSWFLIHSHLDLPLALAVSAALLSCAVAVLKLPHQWDYIYVRRIAKDITQIVMIATACFALHRLVELMIEFVQHQTWISRSHMEGLYREIASKVGRVVKVLGFLLIVVSIVGLTAEETWTRKVFFAFVTAIALGLFGWVLFEMSEFAQELISSATLMVINMFTVGDHIELFLQEHGAIRGRIVDTNTRTTEITHQGSTVHVPNSFFLKACVVNHSRSSNCISLPLFLNVGGGGATPEKIREFTEAARKIAASMSKESSAFLKGHVSSGPVPFVVEMTLKKRDNVSDKKTEIMLKLVQLAQEMNVPLSA